MPKDTVLVVDDEKNIRNLLTMYLEQGGFAVEGFEEGLAMLRYLDQGNPAQLVILDIMLPGMDGFQVCTRIRAGKYPDMPILMLTARDDDVDKIVGLEIGADDYVTKPFNPREVVARVKAILRRSQNQIQADEDEIIQIGDMIIDERRRTVIIKNNSIALRRKEFDLLTTLARQKDIVYSRDQLLEQVWGYDYPGETRTVDVHISSLRGKLTTGDVRIETVTGIGYRLTVVS